MYDHNLDDYGFYEVGNTRYYSKIAAILEHQRLRLPLRWNYLDEEFDQHDWTVEPAESLDQLYANRAQQLREQYDYLVLHFSGGSDSANILETFIKHNIHLDEILIRGSYGLAPKSTGLVTASELYAECLTQGIPIAQWVKDNHLPHLKITLIDTTQLINNYYTSNPDWVEHAGVILTPGICIKSELDSLSPHYRKLSDQGIRIGHIYGADKPQISRRKSIFYTRWLDTLQSNFSIIRNSNIPNPQYIECFYWGRHSIQMQIKQLHVLKNHIKTNNVPDYMFNLVSCIQHGMTSSVAGRYIDNYIAGVIYNRTLPLITEHLKPSGLGIIKEFDDWFIKDPNSIAYQNYKKGIDYLGVILPKEWVCDGGIWSKTGIMPLYSKLRHLGI